MLKRHHAPLGGSADVPAWWEPLFEASHCKSIFLSRDWMRSWIDVYGRDFRGEWVHWTHEDQVIGGCLVLERVVRVKGVPLRSLFINATGLAAQPTPLAEFNDVLHLAPHRAAIAADLAQWLARRPWTRCFLSGYEDGSLFAVLAPQLECAERECETRPAPYVDLRRFGDRSFDAAFTGNTGTQVRKNRRLYEGRFGALSVRPAASMQEALRFFDEMTRLHVARWQAQGESTTFSSRSVLDFHRLLIRRLWEQGCVEVVRVGGERDVIGYLYNYLLGGKVFFFQSGFDYEHEAARSPGMLTHALAIDHYRQRALGEYDFLAGDARYKRSLAHAHRDLHWTILYKKQLWARAFLLGRRWWSRWSDRKALPEAA